MLKAVGRQTGWGWKGFDRLSANVARDLLPHAQSSEALAEYDSAKDQLVIEYHLGRSR